MAEPIGRALAAAERAAFTRPIPKTPQGQLSFLLRQAKDSTKALAGMLGVSPRQALRYKKGEARPPADKLRRAVEERWQPLVRKKARQKIAEGGIVVELRARFGFTAAPGTTDDARMRNLIQPLPPPYGRRLLDATSERQRRQILAQGLGEYYFRERNTRASGVDVVLTDIEHVEIGL